MITIGIATVATNRYIHYWEKMVESFDQNVRDFDLTFHVFTEQLEAVNEFCELHPGIDVRVHKIDSLGWPLASLYRYKLVNSISDQLTETILMHLDADMLVLSNFDSTFHPEIWEGGIGLVAHPGYWRPRGLNLVKLYLRFPRKLVADVKSILENGGLGSWCANPDSKSFVPKKMRKNYYCGGTWMGRNAEFKEMVSILDNSVSQDEIAGVMATWHDESHLNKWATWNAHSTLSPSYCFDPSYPHLSGLDEIIRAVDKNAFPK